MDKIVNDTVRLNTKVDVNESIRICCWDKTKVVWIAVSPNHEQNIQTDVGDTVAEMHNTPATKRLRVEKKQEPTVVYSLDKNRKYKPVRQQK